MKLDHYLQARGESIRAFSARSGVPRVTLQNIINGQGRCRIDIAKAIEDATRAAPVRRKFVRWLDLLPEGWI